jgi:hypothetical protein
MPDNKVIVQFKHVGPAPSLSEAATQLGVSVSELDATYGVISTDAASGLYSVLVEDPAVNRVEAALNARQRDPAEGVFPNSKVEPFGKPKV